MSLPAQDVTPPGGRCRRKEARPGELIEAALEVFVERGYAAARLEDIAQRAGVTKGTVYLYFTDKEELFEAVVQQTLGGMVARGHAIAAGHKGRAADLLCEILGHWWADIVCHPRASALPKLLIAEACNFPRLARAYYQIVIEPGRALLRDVLNRGIERGEFRPVAVDNFVQFIIGPLVYRQCMQHSLQMAVPGMQLGDSDFLRSFEEHLLASLAPHAGGTATS